MFAAIIHHLGSRRLMVIVGLFFALQVVLSPVCSMASNVPSDVLNHAATVEQTITVHDDILHQCAGHGDRFHASNQQHPAQHDCFHCNAPDEAAAAFIVVSTSSHQLALWIAIPSVDTFSLTPTTFAARMPTGPPRSRSLLFSTSQRIRI
jgi:hypothetical protein